MPMPWQCSGMKSQILVCVAGHSIAASTVGALLKTAAQEDLSRSYLTQFDAMHQYDAELEAIDVYGTSFSAGVTSRPQLQRYSQHLREPLGHNPARLGT